MWQFVVLSVVVAGGMLAAGLCCSRAWTAPESSEGVAAPVRSLGPVRVFNRRFAPAPTTVPTAAAKPAA